MAIFLSILSGVALFVVGLIAAYGNQAKLIGAFLVGALGSLAYITALYFKFIGADDRSRSIIFKPFCKEGTSKVSPLKCAWYGAVGGFVAAVFQYDVPNFVAIQSLILGATWPAVVAQFLSGRLSAPNKEEQEALDLIEKAQRQSASPSIQPEELRTKISEVEKKRKGKSVRASSETHQQPV